MGFSSVFERLSMFCMPDPWAASMVDALYLFNLGEVRAEGSRIVQHAILEALNDNRKRSRLQSCDFLDLPSNPQKTS